MIFQDPYSSLNPRMTVFEIVSEVLEGQSPGRRAANWKIESRSCCSASGLRPEYMRRYPHAFSGGERQRIVIARALATNPRLIVADEAISALDVSIRAQILNLLEDLQAEFGLTYLFIAHDLSVIRHICDRVNVMYVGKLVESAEATTLYTHPKHPYTEALMSAVPIHNPRLRDRAAAHPVGRRCGRSGQPAERLLLSSALPVCPGTLPDRRTRNCACSKAVPVSEEHWVACHFAEELHLRGVITGRTSREEL